MSIWIILPNQASQRFNDVKDAIRQRGVFHGLLSFKDSIIDFVQVIKVEFFTTFEVHQKQSGKFPQKGHFFVSKQGF